MTSRLRNWMSVVEGCKNTALAALVMGISGAAVALPNITIFATSGTRAGGSDSATKSNYTAGRVSVENLVNAVPKLKDIANVKGEQVGNIGAQDINDNVWLTLAKKLTPTAIRPTASSLPTVPTRWKKLLTSST